MGNEVYANGRELACKAGQGKSTCAFPDVCFTPPLTPATPSGVPLPYPNTAMAGDTTDGSKNVKISGQEVVLKNKSALKKSVGNEAGSAPKKGLVTSTNKGKAYFTAWSMDVKFEGENVVRHLDLTTHNHSASQPGQTPPFPFIDAMTPAQFSDQCILRPYKPPGCPQGQTPHHVVLNSAFKNANGSYRYGMTHHKGLCVCVPRGLRTSQDLERLRQLGLASSATGHINKALIAQNPLYKFCYGPHGRIHKLTDDLIKTYCRVFNKQEMPLYAACAYGAQAVSEVTGCDKESLEKQCIDYHQTLSPPVKRTDMLRTDMPLN